MHVGNKKIIKSFRHSCTLKTSRAVEYVTVRQVCEDLFAELSISPLCSSVEPVIITSNYSNEHLEAKREMVIIFPVGETEALRVKWTAYFSRTTS